MTQTICPQCNKEFVPSKHAPKKIYCSKKCNQQTDKRKEYLKKYQQSDKYKESQREYQQSDAGKEVKKKYQQSDKGKKNKRQYAKSDKYTKYQKEYQQEYLRSDKYRVFRKKYKEVIKKRFKSEPKYKLKIIIRNRLTKFLKVKNIRKTNSTFKILGCTPEFLKEYLEKQFKTGMTWKNHKVKGWHIDHKIPLDRAKTQEDLNRLGHYTNLQPMWAEENLKKSNK
jgi:hypothetical protein